MPTDSWKQLVRRPTEEVEVNEVRAHRRGVRDRARLEQRAPLQVQVLQRGAADAQQLAHRDVRDARAPAA